MIRRFGTFELDEDSRSLRLQGEPVAVQPLVFDLLAHFLRNAGRVIPKSELMDALWPDINVTEASLQRAVSLARRALAAGGLEDAIRSYVRHGYRFAIDHPGLGTAAPQEPSPDGEIEAARRCARNLDWVGAAEGLSRRFEAGGLEPADIDLWALAVECQGRPVKAIPILVRAVAAHVAAGRPDRAGRAAATIAKIELERSALAAAKGWLERAESLLRGEPDSAATAYLYWMKGRVAIFSGEAEGALAFSSKAIALAEIHGDAGLRAVTLAYHGFYNLCLGRMDEGSELQNHAAAIALSSEVDPIAGSLVYCNILWSCRTYADWARARQWSEGFDTWCETCFAEIPGACDLHRAEVLGVQGTLGDALARIESALPKLADEEAWSIGEGYRVRGDIHAMIGNLAAAREDYALAYATGWDAEPGNAILLFESGDVDAALSALDRSLQGLTWFHLQRRGLLLVNRARIAALGGRGGLAEDLLAEVEASPGRWSQPAVRALLAETRSALCSPGDPRKLQLLLLARQLWTSAGIDYQAARVRTAIARYLLEAGDPAGAALEISAAELTADRIGSDRLKDAVGPLKSRLIGIAALGRAATA